MNQEWEDVSSQGAAPVSDVQALPPPPAPPVVATSSAVPPAGVATSGHVAPAVDDPVPSVEGDSPAARGEATVRLLRPATRWSKFERHALTLRCPRDRGACAARSNAGACALRRRTKTR